ncbi:MAG: hypothetical protein RR262_17630 [Clostridium sp.]
MEINKIVGELRNKYGELKGYIVKEKIIVSVEKISNIYESTKDNILYITTVDVLNSMEKDLSNTNFIVIENSKETIKPKEQCNLIYIGENVSIEKLYNEVKSMLDQNIEENTIISDLYSVMPLEQYLEPLLDKAFKYMQNPITYYDHLHNVKDFRKNKTIDNTAWEKDIELGHMDYSALKEHFYLCLETLINKGEIEFPVLKNRCKIYTIKYEKTVLGFMAALEYNREFKELDFKILSTVAHIIAIKSFNNTFTTSADGYIYSDVFKELLDEKIKSKVEFQGLLKTRN